MSGKRIPFILGYLAKKTDTQYARFFLSLPPPGHGNITLTTHTHTHTLVVTRSFYRDGRKKERRFSRATRLHRDSRSPTTTTTGHFVFIYLR